MIYHLQEVWSYFLDRLVEPLSWAVAIIVITLAAFYWLVTIREDKLRADEIDGLE